MNSVELELVITRDELRDVLGHLTARQRAILVLRPSSAHAPGASSSPQAETQSIETIKPQRHDRRSGRSIARHRTDIPNGPQPSARRADGDANTVKSNTQMLYSRVVQSRSGVPKQRCAKRKTLRNAGSF